MARELFTQANALGKMRRSLEKLLFSSETHPEAGALWVEACWANGRRPRLKKVLKLLQRSEAGRRALVQFIRYLNLEGATAKFPRILSNSFRRITLARLQQKIVD